MTNQQHAKKFNDLLQGKTVKKVRYLSKKEADSLMWHKRPVVIEFADGTFLLPQMDDEGNDGGAMLYGDYNDRNNNDIVYTL